MSKSEISLDDIFKSKLSLEEYFVLHCLYLRDRDILLSYINECKPIDASVYEALEAKGYAILNKDESGGIFFSRIVLTKDGKCLFGSLNEGSALLFEEFRNNYPSSVKAMTKDGFKVRRLHGNKKKCRKLYEEALKEVSHETLCKCVRLYHKELRDSGDEIYMQSMETWLRQRNYEQYLDEDEDVEQVDFTHDI